MASATLQPADGRAQNNGREGQFSSLTSMLVVGVLGAVSAVVITYEPLLIFALALAGSLALLLFRRPALALKIMLLIGGIPLEGLGENSIDPGEKPLLRAFGGTTVDGLCLVTLTFALTCLLLTFDQVRVPKVMRPYLYFLAFCALSLLYSSARLDGLRLMMKVTYPVLIFLGALIFIRTRREVDSAIRYWIAGGILATIIGGMVYALRGPEAFVLGGDFRYSSGLLHESPFSMYMFALFAVCYGIWRSGGEKRYAALALLFGVQAMMAQTRITWAAVLIGLFVFEATMGRRLRTVLRAARLIVGIGFVLVYVAWHSPELQHRFFSGQFDEHASAVEMTQELNFSGRGLLWEAVYEDYWLHNRWIGQGLGSSAALLAASFPGGAVPHNEYLRILHDAGVIGLFLFVVAIVGLFRRLHSLLTDCVTRDQGLFVRISLMILAGYVLEAITDNPLDYYLVFSQYLFFIIGLAVVTVDKSECSSIPSS